MVAPLPSARVGADRLGTSGNSHQFSGVAFPPLSLGIVVYARRLYDSSRQHIPLIDDD